MTEVKVYGTRGPVMSDPIYDVWLIGPLHHWKVGDEVAIPERPPRYGLKRPGCDRARVTQVEADGTATAVAVTTLDAREQKPQSRYA